MPWTSYELIFRLKTPAHIGLGRVGNVQRTRPYITGRVVWGALTMRLKRDANGACTYQDVGARVHQELAYSYFYPATKSNGCYQVAWPWEDASSFRYRFLSSYSGTALTSPQQSVAVGTLHEVEFLAPHRIDSGEPVFLVGYVFEADGCSLKWREACERLQVGGERGYGWGDLALISCLQPTDCTPFLDQLCFDGRNTRPVVRLETSQALLAHTSAAQTRASGTVEPLVGREWNNHPGQQVVHSGVCFAPGSRVEAQSCFEIGHFGLWYASKSAALT